MTLLELAKGILDNRITGRKASSELHELTPADKNQEQLIHFLYHYIADDDIRKRDADYRTSQNQNLSNMINELKISQNE